MLIMIRMSLTSSSVLMMLIWLFVICFGNFFGETKGLYSKGFVGGVYLKKGILRFYVLYPDLSIFFLIAHCFWRALSLLSYSFHVQIVLS